MWVLRHLRESGVKGTGLWGPVLLRVEGRNGKGREDTGSRKVKAELWGLGLLRDRSGTVKTQAPKGSGTEQRRLRFLRGRSTQETTWVWKERQRAVKTGFCGHGIRAWRLRSTWRTRAVRTRAPQSGDYKGPWLQGDQPPREREFGNDVVIHFFFPLSYSLNPEW